jgi:hypothetical protein
MSTGKTYSTKYLLDTNNNRGAEGQVLISTSEGVNWSDGSDITGGPYLPLSAGSSYPLTGGLSFSITTDTVSPVASIKYNSNNYVYFTGGTSGALFGNSNQSVRLQTNATSLQMLTGGSSRMFIDSAGNVGIGTTSPDEKLHVVGNVFLNANSAFKASYNNTDNYHGSMRWAGLQLGNNGANRIVAGRTDTGGGFQFWTNNTNDAANYTVTPDGIMTMAMTETGNVGIGTTSPSAKLQIDKANANSSVIISRSGNNIDVSTGIGSITFPSHYNSSYTDYAAIQAYSNALSAVRGSLDFKVKSTSGNLLTGMTVYGTSSGVNVGIGTTSPGYKLSVNGDIQIPQNEYIYFDNTAHYIRRGSSDVELQGFNGLNLRTNGSSRLYINQDGNVGIGTTSPNTLLDVSSANFGTTAPTVRITNTLNVGDWSGVTSDLGRFEFFADDTSGNAPYTLGYIGIKNDYTTGTPTLPSGAMVFATTTYNASGGAVERMRITSEGDVGIGTSTPNAKLDIQGTQGQLFSVTDDLSGDIFSVADISGVPIMNVNSDGTSYFDGNVGIGTDSPDTKLHIRNTTNSQLTIERTGTAPGKYGFYTNTGNLFINNVTGGASTIPMIILNNGNVGIGAGNPSSKLAIDGGFDYPTVRWFSSNNTSRYMQVGMITPTEHSIRAYGSSSELTFWTASSFSMVIDSGGNVGIGTTSPGYPLEVDGGTGSGVKIKAGNTANDDSFLVSNNNDVSKFLVQGDGKVIINSSAGVPTRTENFQVFGKQIITNTGTDGPVLYLGYNSSGSNTIQLGRGRTADGLSYMDFNGEVMSAGEYGFRIIRYSGQNAGTELKQVGTGAFKVICSDNANIILNPNSGSVGISQTNPSYKLDVTGDGRFTSTVTAANFILSSDERLKENVEKVCDNKVEADWKTFELKTEKGQKRYGVIAQELEKTNPEFVREDSQGFKSVAYIDLLIAKIAELEARLEKLEK